jgi:hypothetical protein
MKIGTDASLAECYKEGYTVIEFKVRELFPNGRKNPMNKDCYVDIIQSIPEHIRAEIATEGNPFGVGRFLDESYSFNGLVEIFEEKKEELTKFGDLNNCPIDFKNPSEYDFLSLADTIHAYMGLNT